MGDGILRGKSFDFSIRIVKLCRRLYTEKEFVISNQLLRSGTSIGANIEEAQYAQSKKDFISKLSIALKEAAETKYWLRLLQAVNEKESQELKNLIQECTEIIKLLTASLNKAKSSV